MSKLSTLLPSLKNELLAISIGDEYEEWMNNDQITVDWLSIGLLKQFNGCYLVGGHEEECLAEVTLLMNAFNIKYTMIKQFIYN